MTGSVARRGKNRYALILNTLINGTRKQRWITFHADPTLGLREQRKAALAKLHEILNDHHKGTYVEPSGLTLLAWLRRWLETSVKPPMRRVETYRVYRNLVETHIAPSTVGGAPLQQLRGSDLERLYRDLPLAPSSIAVLHALLHRALRKAVKDKLLTANPAVDLERVKPDKDAAIAAAQRHCWSASETKQVLDAAKTASPQLAAYVFLALDSGARKGELDGLLWSDLDFESGVLTIARQLDSPKLTADGKPDVGPTKTKVRRTVTLGPETLARLRAHRQAQAELKMRNRTTYQDFGLMFAREEVDLLTPGSRLGEPLVTLSANRFRALVKTADVKVIKFHGCRHTVATLSLQAGTPPHVVAARLGHAVTELLTTYAHCLPDQQQDAAARLSTLLHG